MYSLEQFIHEASMAQDIGRLQTHWTNFVRKFGAEGYRIATFSADVQEQSDPLIDIAYDTPKGWVEHYRKHGFHRIDPLVAKGLVDPGPFTFAEGWAERRNTETDRLASHKREFGIVGDGISIGLWMKPGRMISTGLYVPSGRVRLDDITKRTLQAGFFVFSARYQELVANKNIDRDRPIALTPRECDVLRWIALGKTKQEVADVLRVSTSCIKRHCENAYRKLGVKTLASAVARAMSYGFIKI